MRDYLTVKMGVIPTLREVYETFKGYARPEIANKGVEDLVRDIREHAGYFCALALRGETDPDLALAFQDLRELKVDVAYPFLMVLYKDYVNGVLTKADFAAILRLVEAYVFRRAVCEIPPNSLNKTFANLAKALDKDRYLESVTAQFQLMPSYRRLPDDEEFKRHIQTRDLYKFRSRSYWLRRMQNHGRKERVLVDEYSIEHILPQNENLSSAWREALGQDWQRVQQTWLHTLGNLTLTGYNSEYSDRPFAEKRDMAKGFKSSPLKMNEGLGQLQEWNEDAIKQRASRLAELACDVWRAPSLSAELLDTHRTNVVVPATYTVQDHQNLLSGPNVELFAGFREQVLALDPCVTEEFLKLYVAYKAETNFVDVVPQAKRLRLSLNMPFPEIADPKGFCTDATGLGRWGNGDVSAVFESLDDLPYVMGLVRQSFERQMGDGSDA